MVVILEKSEKEFLVLQKWESPMTLSEKMKYAFKYFSKCIKQFDKSLFDAHLCSTGCFSYTLFCQIMRDDNEKLKKLVSKLKGDNNELVKIAQQAESERDEIKVGKFYSY